MKGLNQWRNSMGKVSFILGSNADNNIQPEVLENIIGQEKAKNTLKFYLKAQNGNSPFPSLLFAGSHGLGKTHFAKSVAKALGRVYFEINCSNMTKKEEFIKFLIHEVYPESKPATILFDEAHALSGEITNLLLTLLNPNKENVNSIQLDSLRELKWNMLGINIIFATTHTYQMFRPLKNRCQEIYFNTYSDKELIDILQSYLPNIHFSCDEQELAYFCRGRARDAFKLSQDIGRVIDVTGDNYFEQKDFEHLAQVLNMHQMGITDMEFNLIKVIQEYGFISAANIASKMGIEEHNVVDELEPRLRELRLIDSTSKGRMLTEKGKIYYEKVQKANEIENYA